MIDWLLKTNYKYKTCKYSAACVKIPLESQNNRIKMKIVIKLNVCHYVKCCQLGYQDIRIVGYKDIKILEV